MSRQRALLAVLVALSAVVITQAAAETQPEDTVPENGDWRDEKELSDSRPSMLISEGRLGLEGALLHTQPKAVAGINALTKDLLYKGLSNPGSGAAAAKQIATAAAKKTAQKKKVSKIDNLTKALLSKDGVTGGSATTMPPPSDSAATEQEVANAKIAAVKKELDIVKKAEAHLNAKKELKKKLKEHKTSKHKFLMEKRQKILATNAVKTANNAARNANDAKTAAHKVLMEKKQKIVQTIEERRKEAAKKDAEKKTKEAAKKEAEKKTKEAAKKKAEKKTKEAKKKKLETKAVETAKDANEKEVKAEKQIKALRKAAGKGKGKGKKVHTAMHTTAPTAAPTPVVGKSVGKGKGKYTSSLQNASTVADVLKHLQNSMRSSLARQKAIQGRANKSLREHGVHVDEAAVNATLNRVSQKDRKEKLEIGAKKEVKEKAEYDVRAHQRNRKAVDLKELTKKADIQTQEQDGKWTAKELEMKANTKAQTEAYEEKVSKYHYKMNEKKRKVAEKKHKLKVLDNMRKEKELRQKQARNNAKRKELLKKQHREQHHKNQEYKNRWKSMRAADKKYQEALKKHKKMAEEWEQRTKEHEVETRTWQDKHKEQREKNEAYLHKKAVYHKQEQIVKHEVTKAKQKELAGKEEARAANESHQKEHDAALHLGWLKRLEAARNRIAHDKSHEYLHSAAERLARSNLRRFLPGNKYEEEKPIQSEFKHSGNTEITAMPPSLMHTSPPGKPKKHKPAKQKAIASMPGRFAHYANEANIRNDYKDLGHAAEHDHIKVSSHSTLQKTLESKDTTEVPTSAPTAPLTEAPTKKWRVAPDPPMPAMPPQEAQP